MHTLPNIAFLANSFSLLDYGLSLTNLALEPKQRRNPLLIPQLADLQFAAQLHRVAPVALETLTDAVNYVRFELTVLTCSCPSKPMMSKTN